MYNIRCLVAGSILISASAMAERIDYSHNYQYEKVKILSCETAEKLILKKTNAINYAPAQKNTLIESSKHFIILEALPLAEVEYITSVYNGRTTYSLGRVEPMAKQAKIKFHMQWKSCESYPKDKEIIMSISKGYHCSSERNIPPNWQTEAGCLIEYEEASEARLGQHTPE